MLLIQRGNAWIRNMNSLTRGSNIILDHTRYFVPLHNLPCVINSTIFRKLFTHGSPRLPGEEYLFEISLQHFSDRNLSEEASGSAVVTRKNRFVEALSHFEQFILFTCGDIYLGITADISNRLQHGDLSNHIWDCGYVQYLIEFTIHSVLHDIKYARRKTYLHMNPSIDLSLTSGIRLLWILGFQQIVMDPSAQAFYLREKSKRVVHKSSTIINKAIGGVNKNNNSSTSSLPKSNSDQLVCKRQLLHDLNLNNKLGQRFPVCKNNTNCSYLHLNVESMSKEDLIKTVTVMASQKTARDQPLISDTLLTVVKEAINKR
jgi:hypothetical protein